MEVEQANLVVQELWTSPEIEAAMRTLLIILITLTACCAGLIMILSVSYVNYETPGIEDAMGFGSKLVFASLFLVPICYLPAIYFLRKTSSPPTRVSLIGVLVLGGNLPLYVILWIVKSKMGYGEVILFLIGFVVVAVVFGIAYPLTNRKLEARKSIPNER
jgi:hypothetical protein